MNTVSIGAVLGGFLGLRLAIWIMATALILSTGIQLNGPTTTHQP
ncbi:hypothetical protein AB0M36_33445 [Actinoplanes sp. NPDC051346]